MAYAAVSDMIALYGNNELIRLTTPDGEPLTTINTATATLALLNASQKIDTYLRKRYLVPVTLTENLPELTNACCIMARYQLSFGEGREPTEQMRLANKEIVTWLEGVRDGINVLDGAIPTGDESYAMMQDRGFTTFQDDGDATGANTGAACNGDDIPVTDQSFWSNP